MELLGKKPKSVTMNNPYRRLIKATLAPNYIKAARIFLILNSLQWHASNTGMGRTINTCYAIMASVFGSPMD